MSPSVYIEVRRKVHFKDWWSQFFKVNEDFPIEVIDGTRKDIASRGAAPTLSNVRRILKGDKFTREHKSALQYDSLESNRRFHGDKWKISDDLELFLQTHFGLHSRMFSALDAFGRKHTFGYASMLTTILERAASCGFGVPARLFVTQRLSTLNDKQLVTVERALDLNARRMQRAWRFYRVLPLAIVCLRQHVSRDVLRYIIRKLHRMS